MTTTTLCYIENEGKYLMLHRVKKKNDINEGKWIGVGGHAEGQEAPEECLVREVKEETGLILTSYRFRDLCWVDKAEVPKLPTWEGDSVFLEMLLSGEERFFSLKLRYEGDKLVEKNVHLY